jgi:hypothetical protein
VAPRLSLLFPTGSESVGRGAGTFGIQGNLPVSVVIAPALVGHLNAGATILPSAHGPFDARATTTAFNLGASAVWLARPWLNLLVETIWVSEAVVVSEGVTDRLEAAVLNPGLRWAFDVGAVQVVPGVSYTIGIGPSRGDDALFLYLSFEHAFRGER